MLRYIIQAKETVYYEIEMSANNEEEARILALEIPEDLRHHHAVQGKDFEIYNVIERDETLQLPEEDDDVNQANDMVDGNGDMIDMDLINGGE